MSRHPIAAIVPPAVVMVLAIAHPAPAGPLILHHPLKIAGARSLPWGTSSNSFEGASGYDIRRLVTDTETLLSPSMPVIVRMETLRRAALYASQDAAVARDLLAALRARAERSSDDALAAFDVAYLTAAFQQVARLDHEPQFQDRARRMKSLPGLGEAERLMERAIGLRRDDPSFTFAMAIVASVYSTDRSRYYAGKAESAAQREPLLAANIEMLH